MIKAVLWCMEEFHICLFCFSCAISFALPFWCVGRGKNTTRHAVSQRADVVKSSVAILSRIYWTCPAYATTLVEVCKNGQRHFIEIVLEAVRISTVCRNQEVLTIHWADAASIQELLEVKLLCRNTLSLCRCRDEWIHSALTMVGN